MNNRNMPDFLIRAAKTFIQAFIPVIIANIAAITTHVVNWDFADWKGWLLPILISAFAAGIAALWNFIIEKLNQKAQAQIFNSMTQEEMEQLLKQVIENNTTPKEEGVQVTENEIKV